MSHIFDLKVEVHLSKKGVKENQDGFMTPRTDNIRIVDFKILDLVTIDHQMLMSGFPGANLYTFNSKHELESISVVNQQLLTISDKSLLPAGRYFPPIITRLYPDTKGVFVHSYGGNNEIGYLSSLDQLVKFPLEPIPEWKLVTKLEIVKDKIYAYSPGQRFLIILNIYRQNGHPQSVELVDIIDTPTNLWLVTQSQNQVKVITEEGIASIDDLDQPLPLPSNFDLSTITISPQGKIAGILADHSGYYFQKKIKVDRITYLKFHEEDLVIFSKNGYTISFKDRELEVDEPCQSSSLIKNKLYLFSKFSTKYFTF